MFVVSRLVFAVVGSLAAMVWVSIVSAFEQPTMRRARGRTAYLEARDVTVLPSIAGPGASTPVLDEDRLNEELEKALADSVRESMPTRSGQAFETVDAR